VNELPSKQKKRTPITQKRENAKEGTSYKKTTYHNRYKVNGTWVGHNKPTENKHKSKDRTNHKKKRETEQPAL